MRNSPSLFWLVSLIVPLLMVVPVDAQPPSQAATANRCAVPLQNTGERPDPKGVPTQVLIGIYVIDIGRINDVEQSFSADVFLQLRWKDPRLASVAHCKFTLNEVWNPRVFFINQASVSKEFEDIVVVGPEGGALYRQRFVGEVSSPIDLREFPLDRQVFRLRFLARGYTPEEVAFVPDERIDGREELFSIATWSIGPLTKQIGTFYFAPQDRSFSRIDYELIGTRRAGFYVWKVIFPLMLFVFMSWAVFWLDPSQLGTQVGLSATVMVICVIFMLNLGTVLPKVPYLTRVDRFVVGSLVLVFLALVQAITSGALAAKGKQDLARKLDRWSRGVFPTSFAVLLVIAFFL
jgi:gamma-aminobutyric acid receptor subunit beta